MTNRRSFLSRMGAMLGALFVTDAWCKQDEAEYMAAPDARPVARIYATVDEWMRDHDFTTGDHFYFNVTQGQGWHWHANSSMCHCYRAERQHAVGPMFRKGDEGWHGWYQPKPITITLNTSPIGGTPDDIANALAKIIKPKLDGLGR